MYTLAIRYTPYLTRAMALFSGVIALSVFLYGVFLLEAIGNTAERASAEQGIQALGTTVSSLEAEYLSQTRALTLDRAHALGFVDASQVTTVFATAETKSLSMSL